VLREAMNYALLKGSIKDGLNYQNSYSSGQELTEFGLREFEEKAETLEFKLKNGYSAEASRNESSGVAQKRNVLSQLTKVGLVFALVIVVMWAGSAISVEMNNGSIKSLIIAPVRRGKIFAAKFMTLVELVLAVTLVNYLVSYFFTILMYGFKYTGTLVYVDALGPHAMPFWLALLLELLIDGIAILLFGALAMCLSALTKNTAVSVAVPMGIFLGGLIVDLILSEVMSDKPFVLAMMPIQNLGNLHFTNGQISSIFKLIGESQAYPMGRLFSYAYVLILITAFTWCAADSFCRKDIT